MWCAALLILGFAAGFWLGAPLRPDRADWAVHLQWQPWWRYPALVLVVVLGLMGVADLIVAAFPIPLPPEWAPSEGEAGALGVQFLGCAALVLIMVRKHVIIATQDGLYCPDFIPWREIIEIRLTKAYLWIELSRPISWDQTKGYPRWLLTASESEVSELKRLHRQHSPAVGNADGAA